MPLNERNGNQEKCTILIVDNDDHIGAGWRLEVEQLGHRITVVSQRDEALAVEGRNNFDLLVSDLIDEPKPLVDGGAVRSFKLAVTSEPERRAIPELHDIIERMLSFKLRCLGAAQDSHRVREKIDLELPSDLTLMNAVLEYLLDRVAKLGMIEVEQSNLYIALDEAFVNAVKHGNRNDPEKLLRVTAELSAREAIFTVEDEGDGFDVHEIPDPCDPANLFKSSGRGVLLIYNIMDEVEYSDRGNKLKMVARTKRVPAATEPET